MTKSSSPIPPETWIPRAKKHADLIGPIADAFLERRSVGRTHAVYDFLFTYYSCSPLKLKQWVPSFEESLIFPPQLQEEYPWLKDYWFKLEEDVLSLNRERLQENMLGLAKFTRELCDNILKKPPRFSCFGLHEWAMVYHLSPEEIRHKGQPLRLSPQEVAHFVESQTICCSHYDAFRFFTKEARPLNLLNPTLDTRLQMEQGGCVHANMDLYKWSAKLWPWIGSDFLAKTFFLALEGRELDMRASPYDLRDQAFPPICIETEEGRKQYQNEQQLLTMRATTLRLELKQFCERLISL